METVVKDPLGGHLLEPMGDNTSMTSITSTTQLPPESGHSYSSTIQVNAETSRPPSSMSDADIVRPLVDLSPLGELANVQIPGDMVKELLLRFYGEEKASERWTITARDVPDSIAGVLKLLQNGCYRAVVDFTGSYFGAYVKSHAGYPHHTPESIQMLLCRILSLAYLGLYDQAMQSCELFGNLDREDLYFEYFTEEFPEKTGSMVPFSFRVLHAILPAHVGQEVVTLDRLYALRERIATERTSDNEQIWNVRERIVRCSIAWCALKMKEYALCISELEDILKETPKDTALLQYLGRVNLVLGDCHSAWRYFSKAEVTLGATTEETASVHMCRGMLSLASSKNEDAYTHFIKAVEIAPNDVVTQNNLAVAAVYVGRLSEAVAIITNALQGKEGQPHPRLFLNLATMHELESSRSGESKKNLIANVINLEGDSFNTDCLKLL